MSLIPSGLDWSISSFARTPRTRVRWTRHLPATATPNDAAQPPAPYRPSVSYHQSCSLPKVDPSPGEYTSPEQPSHVRPRSRSPRRPRLGAHFTPRIATILARTQERREVEEDHSPGDPPAKGWTRVSLSPSPVPVPVPVAVPRRFPVRDGFGFGVSKDEWMESAGWVWDVAERAGMALEGLGGVE